MEYNKEKAAQVIVNAGLFIIAAGLVAGATWVGWKLAQPVKLLSPCPESGCTLTITDPTPAPTATPSTTPKAKPAIIKPAFNPDTLKGNVIGPISARNVYEGKASYYSRAGCIGCSANMHMANGQPLDDTALTVAYNRSKLGSYVLITNLKTGQQVKAQVTDRGGFEKIGRIIDLTIGTRDAIGCSHLCNVRVEEI